MGRGSGGLVRAVDIISPLSSERFGIFPESVYRYGQWWRDPAQSAACGVQQPDQVSQGVSALRRTPGGRDRLRVSVRQGAVRRHRPGRGQEASQAKHGELFESEAHFFEVKWDGIRALAFLESERTRLLSRRETPLLERYPELEFLRDLESGAVLDGEIVLFSDGRPDMERLLSRQQGKRARADAAREPVTYIVFDLLYVGGESLLDRSLEDRRSALHEYVDEAAEARLG